MQCIVTYEMIGSHYCHTYKFTIFIFSNEGCFNIGTGFDTAQPGNSTSVFCNFDFSDTKESPYIGNIQAFFGTSVLPVQYYQASIDFLRNFILASSNVNSSFALAILASNSDFSMLACFELAKNPILFSHSLISSCKAVMRF